jgi:6-phosphogluconolactonase (cycloisomerase 2 family)
LQGVEQGAGVAMAMNRIALQIIAILIAALTLVNCAQKPCVFGSNGAATERQPLFRAPKAATTDVCPTNTGGGGGGGGGGNGTCSSTLTPNEVLFSLTSAGSVQSLAVSTGLTPLALMCTTVAAPGVEIAVSANKFLYVLNGTTKKINGFVIGHVKPVTLAPIPNQPFSISATFGTFFEMRPDPLGRFLFITDSSVGKVHVFLIDQGTGALTEALNSPFTAASALFTAVTPSGQFVYVTDPNDGLIFIFTIDAGGQLTATLNSPFVVPSRLTADSPIDIAMHSSGKFLITSNFISVASYVIDQTSGDLSEAPGSPYSTGGTIAVQPQFLAIDGTNSFVYVTGRSNQGIIGYSIDQLSGTLTLISTNSFGSTTNADAIVADPAAAQVFVQISGAINTFTIDATTGSLIAPTGTSKFSSISNMVIANVQ